jgi:hypothetical protein
MLVLRMRAYLHSSVVVSAELTGMSGVVLVYNQVYTACNRGLETNIQIVQADRVRRVEYSSIHENKQEWNEQRRSYA